jgi:hypothetical protein
MRKRLAALAALACVSRLPQLLSPNLLVDGDESVLGLMAKHFAAGRESRSSSGVNATDSRPSKPAPLRSRSGSPASDLAPIALKTSMLALWMIGVLFLFLALTHIVGKNRAFWIAAVFVVTPAWAVWSMKARGGYLTAFAASAIVLWIASRRERDDKRNDVGRWLVAGSVSMYEFRNFAYLWTNPPNSLSEARRLRLVINALTSRDVRHVCSMNGLLDTQLMFYGDERVISRWSNASDRHPACVDEVNRAIARREPIAVVGYTNTSGAPGCWDVPICTGGLEQLVPNPETIFTVDGKYFAYVGADASPLRALGFDLPPPAN